MSLHHVLYIIQVGNATLCGGAPELYLRSSEVNEFDYQAECHTPEYRIIGIDRSKPYQNEVFRRVAFRR